MYKNNLGYRLPDGYTADIGIVRFRDELEILLIQRSRLDGEGNINAESEKWALPGGFVNIGQENALDAAIRELKEETGVERSYLRHIGVLDNPYRDQRGVIISNLFYAGVLERTIVQVGDDAQHYGWFTENQLPSLAFDHDYAVKQVFNNIKKDIIDTYLGNPFFENQVDLIGTLIGSPFTLDDLYRLVSQCGVTIEKNTLYKKISRSENFKKHGERMREKGFGPLKVQTWIYVKK